MPVRSFVLTSALLAASAGHAAAPDSTAVERGRAFVEANCAACHAVGARGASPNAEAPPFRTLGRRYDVGALEEALAEGIAVGHPLMPEFVLEPEQIVEVTAYLRGVQAKDARPRRSKAPTSR